MPEVKWEDPPIRGNASSSAYAAQLAEIRKRPGQWARLDIGEQKVSTVATNIRRGTTSGSAPAGSFEAVSRTVDGEGRVYVRFVGDPA